MQKYLFILAILSCFSCNQIEPVKVKTPQELLNHDKMATILTDMHLTEAIASVNDSLSHLPLNRYAPIFKKHGITEQTFKESFNYYKLRPVEIDSIYADVIQRLSLMEAEENGNKNKSLFKGYAGGKN